MLMKLPKIAKIFIIMNLKMFMAIFGHLLNSYFVILSAFCVKNLQTNIGYAINFLCSAKIFDINNFDIKN